MASRLRFKNLKQFNQALAQYQNLTEEGALRLQKLIAFKLLKSIVDKTPVDTGRARGNWQVSTTNPNRVALPVTDKIGSATTGTGIGALENAKFGGKIFIFNNVRYIRYLEDGSSRQAPSGMVKVALAEVQALF